MSKITLIRGDTLNIDTTWNQSSGSPIDITGGTVYFTVNASTAPSDDTAALVQKNVTSHTAPTLGQSRITLTHSDTDSLTPGTYFYDVQLKDASGNIVSQKQDKFILSADITRRIT